MKLGKASDTNLYTISGEVFMRETPSCNNVSLQMGL